ncbi:MAG TPA: ABC transporter ATP-binding protein [Candidatus Methylacidiphilales bacterium]
MSIVISVEHLSKSYRLGMIGGGTLREDVSRWWASLRRKPDPNQKIGEEHHARHMGQDFWALQDVNFQVKEGEILGIIGRNGAGKSTLLKILSRVTAPTSGYVKIKGRIASLLEVGTGFHPELTGRENIFLNGTILGMTKAEIRRKFDEIVAFSEIEEFIDTPVKRYSSGMYVRLAFAVAAHLEPEILIVDEVLAVGDAAFQKKCLGKMNEVSQQGRTVIFVSHNMAMMKTFCETALWISQGAVLESGSPETVINHYLQSGTSEPQNVVNLRDYPRAQLDGGGQLRITRIEWLTGLPLFHTESMSVRIDFETYRDVAESTIGIGFSSLEGGRLLTYETDDPGERIDLKKDGHYSVTMDIDFLPLPPGYYNVDIGSRSGAMQGIDYLPNCFQVEIVAGKKTQGNQARPGAGVRLPSKWQWNFNQK